MCKVPKYEEIITWAVHLFEKGFTPDGVLAFMLPLILS
jgi:hypothetical protein